MLTTIMKCSLIGWAMIIIVNANFVGASDRSAIGLCLEKHRENCSNETFNVPPFCAQLEDKLGIKHQINYENPECYFYDKCLIEGSEASMKVCHRGPCQSIAKRCDPVEPCVGIKSMDPVDDGERKEEDELQAIGELKTKLKPTKRPEPRPTTTPSTKEM